MPGWDSVKKLGTSFCRPCAMIMNENGEYFAADGYGNDAVHKFRADRSYEKSWGGPDRSRGSFGWSMIFVWMTGAVFG